MLRYWRYRSVCAPSRFETRVNFRLINCINLRGFGIANRRGTLFREFTSKWKEWTDLIIKFSSTSWCAITTRVINWLIEPIATRSNVRNWCLWQYNNTKLLYNLTIIKSKVKAEAPKKKTNSANKKDVKVLLVQCHRRSSWSPPYICNWLEN